MPRVTSEPFVYCYGRWGGEFVSDGKSDQALNALCVGGLARHLHELDVDWYAVQHFDFIVSDRATRNSLPFFITYDAWGDILCGAGGVSTHQVYQYLQYEFTSPYHRKLRAFFTERHQAQMRERGGSRFIKLNKPCIVRIHVTVRTW